MQPKHYKITFILVGIASIVGIAPMPWELYGAPYNYYSFLRAFVTLGSLILIFRAVGRKQFPWIILGVFSLVMFSPYLPIELPKSTWVPIDAITGAGFLTASLSLGKKFKLSEIEIQRLGRINSENELGGDIYEDDDWGYISSIAVVLFFLSILGSMTSFPDSSHCDNWVQDPRGGYCD
jgi:hypothetical protein